MRLVFGRLMACDMHKPIVLWARLSSGCRTSGVPMHSCPKTYGEPSFAWPLFKTQMLCPDMPGLNKCKNLFMEGSLTYHALPWSQTSEWGPPAMCFCFELSPQHRLWISSAAKCPCQHPHRESMVCSGSLQSRPRLMRS